MAKKRKTRWEKTHKRAPKKIDFKLSQEANSFHAQTPPKKPAVNEKIDKSILYYDSGFVKKDILKTLLLTAIVISLELVLYFRLK